MTLSTSFIGNPIKAFARVQARILAARARELPEFGPKLNARARARARTRECRIPPDSRTARRECGLQRILGDRNVEMSPQLVECMLIKCA
jgi:hypothetical protein